ncbi:MULTISPECIES: GNAT family N-acetyltransferase [Falsihalocynthiibacter]|uniref:GNAT family N-acetyltransferase n=1 Tax=Falsihalocynthiibacter TaxID=2854182 RepID=UPI0035101E56
MRRFNTETSEIKRMYVQTTARGQGVGGALLTELIATARKLGYRRLVLSTHPSLTSAQSIYRSAGFVVVENPLDFPEYGEIEVCMETNLR